MRLLAYEGGRGRGERRAFGCVFRGGRVERLGFGGGLCVWRGEDVGDGDADSTAVMLDVAIGASALINAGVSKKVIRIKNTIL